MFSWCIGNFQMSSPFPSFIKMAKKNIGVVLAGWTCSSASALYYFWQWTLTDASQKLQKPIYYRNQCGNDGGGWDMKGLGKTLNLKQP